MDETFKINHANRKVLFHYLETLSMPQLNTIPSGFSNNIIWNIGHIVVVQQLLVYNLSGLPMLVSSEMISRYKRGTAPNGEVTTEDVEELKKLLFLTLEQTQKDFEIGTFEKYMEYTTMTGYRIPDAKAAMEFNNFHEGVHLGIIMQLKKFV